jgi:leader peptidase (prepilin peptidase) / N-methyltransferase
MLYILYGLVFLFGTIIGSFLNVVILRLNTGRSAAKGRSKCMTCNKELTPSELLPLFSFLFQKGRCRKCKTRLSWQYPLVEFFTGILFVLLFSRYQDLMMVFPDQFFVLFIFSILVSVFCIMIVVYDARHMIIPDEFMFPLLGLALVSVLYTNIFFSSIGFSVPHLISSLFAGFIPAGIFYALWWVSKGEWIGFADSKLILALGWLIGMQGIVPAVLFAFWTGALYAIIIRIFGFMKITMKTEIPFAPFLILGFAIAFFCNTSWYSLSLWIGTYTSILVS